MILTRSSIHSSKERIEVGADEVSLISSRQRTKHLISSRPATPFYSDTTTAWPAGIDTVERLLAQETKKKKNGQQKEKEN